MPIITIQLAEGRSEEKKAAIARQVSEVIARELAVDINVVTVLFNEYPRQNWATGGELHSRKFGPGCGMDGSPAKDGRQAKG